MHTLQTGGLSTEIVDKMGLSTCRFPKMWTSRRWFSVYNFFVLASDRAIPYNTAKNVWITFVEKGVYTFYIRREIVDIFLERAEIYPNSGKIQAKIPEFCDFFHKHTFFSTRNKSFPHKTPLIQRGINA